MWAGVLTGAGWSTWSYPQCLAPAGRAGKAGGVPLSLPQASLCPRVCLSRLESGLSFFTWQQLGPKRGKAEAVRSLVQNWPMHHFCCLLLVKAFTEPTHFQETPPPGGRSFRHLPGGEALLVAIFAGNPHSPPACFCWPGEARRLQRTTCPTCKMPEDAWALRSLVLLKKKKKKAGRGIIPHQRANILSHLALHSDWEAKHTNQMFMRTNSH